MNAIKHTKLTKAPLAMALGAALVAGFWTQAQAEEFSDFARQARANAMSEATAQPGTAERLNQLRGALEGSRVVANLPSAEVQGEQALAAIRSEQLESLKALAPGQMAGALSGVRVVAMPSPGEQTDQAVAAIRAEQLDDLRRQAPGQIAASMQSVHLTTRVADAVRPAGSGNHGKLGRGWLVFRRARPALRHDATDMVV